MGKAENEMPQSYNHIPLIIYNPKLKPKEMNCFGGQIDVQPTLLGLLGIGYMEFEKEFGISIPDDQAEKIGTVGDAVSYIEEHAK